MGATTEIYFTPDSMLSHTNRPLQLLFRSARSDGGGEHMMAEYGNPPSALVSSNEILRQPLTWLDFEEIAVTLNRPQPVLRGFFPFDVIYSFLHRSGFTPGQICLTKGEEGGQEISRGHGSRLVNSGATDPTPNAWGSVAKRCLAAFVWRPNEPFWADRVKQVQRSSMTVPSRRGQRWYRI